MEIRAAVSHGDGRLQLEEVELDDPRADEVRVKLVASGVCHTDISAHRLATRAPASGYPVVLGHEGAGIVDAVGSSVSRVSPGDRVVMSYRSCRSCPRCLSGRRAYCDAFVALNFGGARHDGSSTLRLNGAAIGSCFFGQSSFATYALANEENVVAVGGDVDLAVAAPLGCGFQTGAGAVLNVLRPQAGSPFAVFAAGSVGLAALLAAKAVGAYPLVVVDPAPQRREMAEALGATLVVDPTDGADVVAAIRDHTGGGVESAFDSSGVPGVVDQAVASLAPGGTLATVAHSGPVQLDIRELIVRGKSIRGVVEGDSLPESFIPSLLELQRSGRFPVEKLIVRYAFDEIHEALRDSEAHTVVKPVLVF